MSPYPAPAPVPPFAPARPATRGSGRSGRLVAGALLVADGGIGILASLLYLGVGDDVPGFFGGPVYAVQTVASLVAAALGVAAFLVAGLATRGPDGIVGASRLAAIGFVVTAAWQFISIAVSRAVPYAVTPIGAWIIPVVTGAEAIIEVALLVVTAIAVVVRGSAGGTARFALLLAPIASVVSVLLGVAFGLLNLSGSGYGIALLAQSLPGAISAALIGTAYLASRGRGIREAASDAPPFRAA